jgi:hypothetical protein
MIASTVASGGSRSATSIAPHTVEPAEPAGEDALLAR